MLPREGWNFDDMNQSAHPCLSAKNEDSSKTENRSWNEHHGECSRWFLKRKMWLEKKHQEVFMTNYSLRFLKLHVYILLWENLILLCTVSRTHDMHRLALVIRACARSFFKASYPTQCCPAKALAWMTQIRTRIRVCQRIIKTQAKLLTGHGKSSKTNVCGNFFKRIIWLGKCLY